MRRYWEELNESDRAAFRAAAAFLNGRLEDRATVDWAIQLKHNDKIKRFALLYLIDSPNGEKISEPWQTAWRLIEESWNNPGIEDQSSRSIYDAQRRIRKGDRSGSLVTEIIEFVSPRLKIEPFSNLDPLSQQRRKKPKKVEDLFRTGLTSGKIVDPSMLDLANLSDQSFLVSLALALESIIIKGLEIARRIGRDGEHRFWQLGGLNRVYYVPVPERADNEHEPDEFSRGIAPSVKLLHAAVSRLVDIDISIAIEFVRRWEGMNSSVHLRLWAALSRDFRVTAANEIGTKLLSLDNQRFWDLDNYPEIAELRAKRFKELDSHEQVRLTARIKKGPPRNQWPRMTEATRVDRARTYWAVRELRRIEIASSFLPKHDKNWLETRINDFPDLAQMARLDDGFWESPKVSWTPLNPDKQYDLLDGEERLKALDTALSSARGGWDDDPAGRAWDWIRKSGNPIKVLNDFELINDGGTAFARVWERFGWAHSPEGEQGEEVAQRDLNAESSRVLSLIARISVTTIRQAIDGISQWFSAWKKQVVVLPEGLDVFLRLWPIAVEATNTKQPIDKNINLNAVSQSTDDNESMDLDTLNSPAGKLVGVFLAACPNLKKIAHPFEVDGAPRSMRNVIIAATGRSGLIARHRMIEALFYFQHADPDWANEYLMAPLNADNTNAIALWRAIARGRQPSDVIKIIGDQMTERAIDLRLSREVRSSLVFSLVIECLHAFNEQREPAVLIARIQQMIRALDDEVRAYAAEAVQRFLRDMSASGQKGQKIFPEDLFQEAVVPFLQQVWPQERSLTTPGVSEAFAELPAVAREAFPEAVAAIERFLVPFECWSMLDYGIYVELDGDPKLSFIDNPQKATALLQLLDLTVGTDEGSVIPYDLADALDQIQKIVPTIMEEQVFRRLATAARRR
jgi:hypothetical protein